MATTKRIIWTPTLNQQGQVTGWTSTFKPVNQFPNIGGSPNKFITKNNDPTLTDEGLQWAVENIAWVYEWFSWWGRTTPTPSRTVNIPNSWTKDNSVALMTAWKTGVTNTLPQGKTDSLPWVTKYAGNNQTYWNNRAGIDLVNRQSELNNLSEAEKAQRLAGAYNPVPTVATTQNPVVKKTLPKEETPVKPDIQAMDLPTIQENIDRLTYKVNSGKSLTEDEYVTFNQLRRQATDMMKPQSLTGWLDNLMQQQQSEITTTQQTLEEQNAKDLEAFTKSQEAYKTSQIAMINQEENLSRQRMAAIFWATGQDSSTDTISTFWQMEQNYSLQKQAKIEEVQAKIDLFWSQQRKDSAETIQKMKDRLYSTQLKAAEFDVANLQEINKYNQEQSKSTLEKLDNLKAMSDSILASSTPLTEEQKAQASVIWQFLVDPDWWLNQALLESYKKTNPNLIPYALSMAVGERNKIQQNKLAMQWLDADIKKAQLNKLLNPAKEYEYVKDADWNTIAVAKDNPNERINITWWNADATVIDTIKKWEWFRDKAYQDSTGTWTIGYWFTNVNWQPVKPWMTMDRWTADNLLWQEISQRQNFMNYITVPLSESQKAALSSFEFNLWSWIREKNAKPILDKINAGDLQWAWNLMKQYAYSKWQKLQGLSNRRNEEARLLLDKWQQQTTEQPSWSKQLPAWNASEIGAMRTAIDQTSNLWSIIEKYKDSMWPIAWNIWKINKYDTEAQKANAEFNRITQIVGKSLEWWKLAEWDIKRYLEMLPSITDNPEVAKSKLISAQQYLKDLYSWQVKSLWEAGYNVKDFYSWIENKQEEQMQSTQQTSWTLSWWTNRLKK